MLVSVGKVFFDVNQTARAAGSANANQPTLISDLVELGDSNVTHGDAHAEIGVIQQAYDAGTTQNQSMTIVVRGEEACSNCRSDLVDMAEATGLNQPTVVNGTNGSVLQWTKGRPVALYKSKIPYEECPLLRSIRR
jgi:filamentous hemagglutinin